VLRALQVPLGLPSPLNPTWFIAVRSLVVKERIDVVIVRDLQVALATIAAGHSAGTPVVLDLAENWPGQLRQWRREEGWTLQNLLLRHPAGSSAVERLAVQHADHIIVVVDEMKERLTRELGADAARVSVVMNTPLDVHAACDHLPVKRSGPLSLVYMGEIHISRGLLLALQAMALARAQGVEARLRVIGQGKPQQERRIRSMRDQIGLTAEVEFLGWMPHDVALCVAAESDIGICPAPSGEHLDTTISNKMFEYMMLGLPVLCSDVKPQKRLMEQTGAGLLFRAGSADDMGRAIRQFTDPALRAACSAAGKKAIAARYRWDFDASVLEAVLVSRSSRLAVPGPGDARAGERTR
jgi:glycosyltransferase involved in cell wall biosynthesis